MNEQGQQAYLELIQTLLTCPSGQVLEILQANKNLIDESFVQVMEREADKMAGSEEEKPNGLKLRRLAGVLALMLDITSQENALEDYVNFLMQVFLAVAADNSSELVYPLLERNLDLLHENWQRILETRVAETLLQIQSQKAPAIAEVIVDFSKLMRKFTQGNRSGNVEIAIAGYVTGLKVFTQSAYPEKWAMTQSNLGLAYYKRIKGDKAENLEAAISAYHLALQVYTQSAYPYEWAMTQNDLGAIYYERIKGDKAENIEQALSAYRLALEVRTQSAFPQDWAATQYNLGIAYNYRIKGNKAENIEQEISAYHQVLQVHTQEDFPSGWAMTQNNLGNAYYYRIKGDKGENLENALAAYQRALSVYTKEAFPTDWAMTQYNLGNVYSNRIKGDKGENLENALAAYQRALSVLTSEAFPTHWASTQYSLGNAYRDRIKGDKAENLEKALAAYQGALSVLTSEAFPTHWAMAQNNLGAAYSDRIKGDRAENLEKALAAFQRALSVRTSSAFPTKWASTQNNLGVAYKDRIKGDKAENLEKALAACQRALSVYTKEAFPTNWALTQNNLGSAYRNRIKGDRAENLEKALAAFQRALSVRTSSAFPTKWASTQNNLGAAYINRIKGDKGENLENALAAYQRALSVYTKEAFPTDWAMTQNNLGSAYINRIKGDKAENLEKALAAFQRALSVYTSEAFPTDWASTQYNLGLAYWNRIKGDKAENLENALAAHQRALSVYTKEAFPSNWAATQNNLGLTYSDRIKGDKGENLENALAAYQRALSVYTKEAFPSNWAGTQDNLGNAYRHRIKGDKAENLEQAIAAYRLALQVSTPQSFPIDCLRTGGNLGNLGFENGNWQVAIEGYELAIAAVEQSRNWAVKEERRQEILRESLGVYDNMVQACINLGQLDKAIEYVERSRSKRLIDLMASNDLYRGGEIPAQVREKLQEYEGLQQQINGERIPHQSDDNQGMLKTDRGSTTLTASSYLGRAAFEAYSENVAQLEAQKQQVWEELRKLDFELASEIQVNPPNLAAMQQLIASPTAAIVSFYSTDDHTHIFILRQNQTPQLYTCTGQGGKTLQLWILENWIQLYVENRTEWLHQMNGFITELAQRLQLEDLISQHLGDIQELILVPHLYLHQIPFAALPINQLGEYLSDKFILRTVPSCQVLEFCHRRPPIAASISYGTVEDATEDLPCAAFECEQIVQMHGIPDRLRLKGSQATVENYRQLAKQVHVLHSSHHAQSRLDNPLESHLQLGNGNITLGELMSPGWRLPDLKEVFLSCCETGFGVTEITDDIITIATGFLCAGARSVIGTLWAVNDIATAMFCIFYYQQRQQGKSRPEALGEAQVRLRNLTGEELSAEYKPQIEPLLNEKSTQAFAARKSAQKQQKYRAEGSPEYESLQKEIDKYGKIWMKSKDSLESLKNYCEEELPFASPNYWAAFTCAGLP
ncbi:MAG: tetratricopeptide repeat protein [Hormoscilla sp.]